MSGLGVTLLTQLGRTFLQHRCVHRTVRLVTTGAVFSNRGMLPKEGTALVGVTAVAQLIGVIPDQQGICLGAVGVVALAAGHLLEPQGMREGLEAGGPLGGMAGVAALWLFLGNRHRVISDMQLVAISTGNILAVVGAAFPVRTQVRLMATQAHGILLRHRRGPVRTELDHRRAFSAALYPAGMFTARSVASLALGLAFAKWCTAIAGCAVRSFQNRHDVLFGMAHHTLVGTLAAEWSCVLLDVLGASAKRHRHHGEYCHNLDGRFQQVQRVLLIRLHSCSRDGGRLDLAKC